MTNYLIIGRMPAAAAVDGIRKQPTKQRENKIMKPQTSFIKPLAISMTLAALFVATPVQAAPETGESI